MAPAPIMELDGQLLVLSGDFSELSRLGAWIREVVEPFPTIAFALELCAEEAVTNVIVHGCRDQAPHRIAVTFAQMPAAVLLSIEDDGIPFDPTTAAPPEPPASLEEAKIGGLGIALMRRYATEMRYESVAGRNRLTLTFARQG